MRDTEYKNLTLDNTVLESDRFEELFIVNSSNQIGVRKLLTPKVISNLVKQINRKTLPVIGVKDDVITFAFDQKDSEYNQNKILDDREIEQDNFYKTLCQKITKDINSFLEALYWVDVLGLK
ncbi:hypothetical protein SSYRP_v1c00820 [Spiroplasma syrphidicola EA-1]|uniref:Uncharacterized protein n=1 Tax=Spiroplasma syrphidicola EA-1 TaxID=1276229 RepID=R4U553_9MOLU|nr:DUF3137 domain-containing protein [Spiroplasma syrphidicola]AGM25678.1 hypothetical protein SSYRP_v1c00820 [Spiroplasma syrphidicola EA-1]